MAFRPGAANAEDLMKTFSFWVGALAAAVLVQAAPAAAPAGPFRVSALKKTVARDQSETQGLPRGSTQLEEKQVVYRFEIQNQSTDHSQQDLDVRWVIMLEGADGRSFQSAPDGKTTVLPFGRPVILETEPIALAERTWRGLAGRTVETGQVIEGYGLQIRTPEGQLLMEKYEPAALKDKIQWTAAAPAGAADRRILPSRPRPPAPVRPNRIRDAVPPPAP